MICMNSLSLTIRHIYIYNALHSCCSFQFHFAMGNASVSVISYPRNILGIMQQSKCCEIQIFWNLTLNLIVTEGSFQHTARAGLPHIILLLVLFLQLFQFHIFVLRFVTNPASICLHYSVIGCLVLLILYAVLSMCLPLSRF